MEIDNYVGGSRLGTGSARRRGSTTLRRRTMETGRRSAPEPVGICLMWATAAAEGRRRRRRRRPD